MLAEGEVPEGPDPEEPDTAESQTSEGPPAARTRAVPPIISDPSDPSRLLGEIVQRETERNALIPRSPINDLSEATTRLSNGLYNDTGVRLGLNINHASQDLSVALPNQPTGGSTTDLDFILSWDVVNRGTPTVGKIYAHLEGRWDYGTRGPQNLGFQSLGSAIGTANAFSGYEPTFLLRNLYWQQGSSEAGWFYRIGRITTDAILGTSKYLSPVTTFLSNASTGFFANAYPDTGYGVVAGAWITDRLGVMALASDAYGNRFTDGDLSRMTFYTAGEIAFKQWPLTENAGYSKITIWNNPGGLPINAMTGRSGWGMSVKLEQELTTDGRLIGIGRWSKSLGGSAAIWDEQASAHLVYNNPRLLRILKDDAIGVGFNWLKVNEETRDEYDIEVFYRFPLFQNLDVTLAYQYDIQPANAVTPILKRSIIDDGSAFTLRLRTTF
ncbi:carbohydrate porin [Synechococcus sp. RSCCF101]|uniref:carbohydrate porin n=1 Tax=Synechococcus sp. RSCCF101 TaxID=2511069 RepID=UPI00178181BD|nr:carbohydrate porin [Synechococcus sp. RSCCF101]